MRNKVQGSASLKYQILLLILMVCGHVPAFLFAQTKKTGSEVFVVKPVPGELKIKQRGSELVVQFPRTHFRSALKLINTNGSVLKALMIDEGMELATVSANGLPKGIYQCVLENRTQRFVKKLMIQ